MGKTHKGPGKGKKGSGRANYSDAAGNANAGKYTKFKLGGSGQVANYNKLMEDFKTEVKRKYDNPHQICHLIQKKEDYLFETVELKQIEPLDPFDAVLSTEEEQRKRLQDEAAHE